MRFLIHSRQVVSAAVVAFLIGAIVPLAGCSDDKPEATIPENAQPLSAGEPESSGSSTKVDLSE